MAASNRKASFLATMVWEGGSALSLNPRDPGNWTGNRIGAGKLVGTKWGVAAGSHPTLDIPNLTEDQAEAIFATGYWNPVDGDRLPIGLDHCVSDDSFNAGPGNARKLMARVGVNDNSDPIQAIKDFSGARLSFLRSLSSWANFGVGWARRVGGVEAESLRMAMGAQGIPQAQQNATINAHVDTINKTIVKHTTGAAVTIPATGTAAVTNLGGTATAIIVAIGAIIFIGFIAYIVVNQARAQGLMGKK